jgi:hypothetical protein
VRQRGRTGSAILVLQEPAPIRRWQIFKEGLKFKPDQSSSHVPKRVLRALIDSTHGGHSSTFDPCPIMPVCASAKRLCFRESQVGIDTETLAPGLLWALQVSRDYDAKERDPAYKRTGDGGKANHTLQVPANRLALRGAPGRRFAIGRWKCHQHKERSLPGKLLDNVGCTCPRPLHLTDPVEWAFAVPYAQEA